MSGERTYCVALTKRDMRLIRSALDRVANNSGLDMRASLWFRQIGHRITARMERIDLEEQSPSPAPPLPLIADEPTHTCIKFGGEI